MPNSMKQAFAEAHLGCGKCFSAFRIGFFSKLVTEEGGQAASSIGISSSKSG
jgi:hypothetical protein